MNTTLSREPVLTAGTIVALLVAGIQLLTVFGVPINPDQQAAIVAFVSALLVVVGALWARSKVTPIGPNPHVPTGQLVDATRVRRMRE